VTAVGLAGQGVDRLAAAEASTTHRVGDRRSDSRVSPGEATAGADDGWKVNDRTSRPDLRKLIHQMATRKRGVSAWLVTWEVTSEEAEGKIGQPVAAILDPLWSGDQVQEFMLGMYFQATCAPSERSDVVPRWKNPYLPVFGDIDRVPWIGERTYRWLRARVVDDLRLEIDGDGNERAVWTERARPRHPPKLHPRALHRTRILPFPDRRRGGPVEAR